MTKQIVMSEAEYQELPIRLACEMLDFAKKSYGVRLVRSEDGGVITNEDEMIGTLMIPLTRALEGTA